MAGIPLLPALLAAVSYLLALAGRIIGTDAGERLTVFAVCVFCAGTLAAFACGVGTREILCALFVLLFLTWAGDKEKGGGEAS